MILIKNKKQLYNTKTRHALQILEAGLDAAKPEHFLFGFIRKEKLHVNKKSLLLSKYGKIYLVAVGKAADSMAKFVYDKIRVDSGIVVIPQNYNSMIPAKNFKIFRAGHPIPNKTSVAAAKSIIKLVKETKKEDLIIFLVSGGASALVCLPDGITLGQKQQITQILLRCGASIKEVNALRKHLSQIKGGRLLEHLNCAAVSFVMSDVVGNDLTSIASGLTYCDKTTYSECLRIIKKYGMGKQISAQAIKRLEMGARGKITETPKRPKIPNIIVASNQDCLDAMKNTAAKLGYKTKILAPLVGNTSPAAKKLLQNFSFRKNSCLIFGGETTVKVIGGGKGGRNQELALQILNDAKENIVVASMGTDGIDGNTKDAGAVFYMIPSKNEAQNYLKHNDSNSFFKKYGGLITTGPTHTNLLDIGLILKS
jgi:hydroxypyruvate reductase